MLIPVGHLIQPKQIYLLLLLLSKRGTGYSFCSCYLLDILTSDDFLPDAGARLGLIFSTFRNKSTSDEPPRGERSSRHHRPCPQPRCIPRRWGQETVLTDKKHIHLRSASVRTYPFFTTGFPRFLSIRGARGLQAFDLPLLTNLSKPLSMVKLENNYTTLERMIKLTR
jgi:hypothetical protein